MTGDLFDFLNVTDPREGKDCDGHIQLDPGAFIFPGMALSRASDLLDATRDIVRQAPFRHLVTPGGHRMSVGMTACGEYGWISDASGYRYTTTQPRNGLSCRNCSARSWKKRQPPPAFCVRRYNPAF